MIIFFRLFAKLPLWLLGLIGILLGWVIFLCAPTYRRTLIANAHQAGFGARVWCQNVSEMGKMTIEAPKLWFGNTRPRQVTNEQLFIDALHQKQGVMVLTPHLGAFEFAIPYFKQRMFDLNFKVSVLFKPSRQAFLRPLMQAARGQGIETVTTNAGGVKQLIKMLKSGQCVGILPDQVPPLGAGVWAPFFGQDAYTMTLAAKLALHTDCALLYAWVERLPWARGFVVHWGKSEKKLPLEVSAAVAQINQELETLVKKAPHTYLWSYNRYRKPEA